MKILDSVSINIFFNIFGDGSIAWKPAPLF